MSDVTPPERPRQPAFNLPVVVTVCCGVLLAIHAVRTALSDEANDAIIIWFAFVPARMAIALHVAQHQLQVAVQNLPQDTFAALIGAGGGRWWTLVTYAFLHGSWVHVGFNCIWLVAFGAPVARRFLAPRFLLLLLVSAIVGAVSQFLGSAASFVPVIGASAAVAGVMGASTRFVFRPSEEPARIFDRAQRNEVFRQPALTLRETFTTKGALAFVVFWFVTNILFGLFPALSGVSDGPIAWQAHIGGFLTGLLLFSLIDPARRPPALDPDAETSAVLPPDPSGDEQAR